MPENDEQDVSAGVQAPVETERERFERERLSRRQALKRFGMTSAMATFALFSVDDLARMVGKAMEQRVADNKVAMQIAQEFQEAGIALASGASSPSPSTGPNPIGCLSGSGDCGAACIKYCGCLSDAASTYQGCNKKGISHINVSAVIDCDTQYRKDKQACLTAYNLANNTQKGKSKQSCCSCNCKNGSPCPDPTKKC